MKARALLSPAHRRRLQPQAPRPRISRVGSLDPVYSSPLFNFEGFYVSGTASWHFPAPSVVGTLGVVVGANFAVNDAILAGVEFQGDTLWNSAGFQGFDAVFLGKLGAYLSDDMIFTAAPVALDRRRAVYPSVPVSRWPSPIEHQRRGGDGDRLGQGSLPSRAKDHRRPARHAELGDTATSHPHAARLVADRSRFAIFVAPRGHRPVHAANSDG